MQNGDVRRSAFSGPRGGPGGALLSPAQSLWRTRATPQGAASDSPPKAPYSLDVPARIARERVPRLEAYATLVDKRSGGHCKTGEPDVQIDPKMG